MVMSEICTRIKKYPLIRKDLKGILAAFTGMLLFVVLSLGSVSLISPGAYIWAVGVLIAVWYYKINILWIFFGWHWCGNGVIFSRTRYRVNMIVEKVGFLC